MRLPSLATMWRAICEETMLGTASHGPYITMIAHEIHSNYLTTFLIKKKKLFDDSSDGGVWEISKSYGISIDKIQWS